MPTPSVQPRHNRRQDRRVQSKWSELEAQEHLNQDVMKAERKILMVLAMATMVSPLLAKSCGREHVEYDQTMSIVSIFVIFAVSILGFMTPAWLARRKDRDMRLIVAACTFGSTAVLFTVGIVHILGDADEDLSNECLPESFLKAFPGWSDLICCITIMVSVMFDYSMHSSLQNKIDRADALACCENGLKEPLNNRGEEEEIWDAEFPSGLDESIQRYAVLLVEVSVCTHSIPVGLDLGLQSADKFAPLFIAVIFHQVRRVVIFSDGSAID